MSVYANEEPRDVSVFIHWNTGEPGGEPIVEQYRLLDNYPRFSADSQYEWVETFLEDNVNVQDVADATDKVLLEVRDAETGDVFFSGFLFEADRKIEIWYPLLPSYDYHAEFTKSGGVILDCYFISGLR